MKKGRKKEKKEGRKEPKEGRNQRKTLKEGRNQRKEDGIKRKEGRKELKEGRGYTQTDGRTPEQAETNCARSPRRNLLCIFELDLLCMPYVFPPLGCTPGSHTK